MWKLQIDTQWNLIIGLRKITEYTLKGNDILLMFAILFLWLNLENHFHSQNALIVSEYKIIIF